MLYPLSYGRLVELFSCVAEARGFEPPVRFKADNSLAVSPIRPLWHASLNVLGDYRTRSEHRNRRGESVQPLTYADQMTARLRPLMADLPAYTPGKTVPGAIKLASNETVDGPLPSVRVAIENSMDTLNRYPDNGYVELKEHLAKHVNFAPENIAAGAGSVSLCQQLIQITASVGDEVMFGWRAFEVYPLQVRVAGATPVQVPLKDYTHDLDAMLAAVTDRTRLIFVCNPNNPTSTVVDPDKLAAFVEAVPSDILVAIDEAYVEYIRDGLVPDSLGLVRNHRNVVVLRTFSKAYGLAGARVGYAVGDPDIITALGKVYVPFTTTSLSQAAAIASISAAEELMARTDAVVLERARVSAALRDAGYELPESQANFVWLPLGPGRTADFVEQAANARVLVRPYGTDGVRVTIGATHENDTFLAFAQGWI
ncbi:histidinol-phosphate transaminase [soil metagenome]